MLRLILIKNHRKIRMDIVVNIAEAVRRGDNPKGFKNSSERTERERRKKRVEKERTLLKKRKNINEEREREREREREK